MASNTIIISSIAQAQALCLRNVDIVDLYDQYIAGLVTGSGAQGYAISGRSMTFISAEVALKIRKEYTNMPEAGDRSTIIQLAEL